VALWEATISLAKTMEVPIEAAGPLFHALSEFQDDMTRNVDMTVLKFVSSLKKIIESYKQGFCYMDRSNCIKTS